MKAPSALSLSVRLGLFLLLAIGLAPTAQPAAAAGSASPSAAKATCNPEADLSGELAPDYRSGTITNTSSSCSYKVGIASYMRFDNNIPNQQLFDSNTATIKPGQTLTLSVKLPGCSAQVDLFYGPVIKNLGPRLYDERKLDWANPINPGAPFCAPVGGRMTGGGSVFTANGQRVTHGFNLRCDGGDKRQSLEINWGNGQRFHLTQLTSVVCSNDPSIDPEHPTSQIDTYKGTGTGRLAGNKTMGTAEWIITDAGEPGVNDRFKITVRDSAGNVLVTADGLLNKGNHQAHR
jgi:hypothetical protein